MAVTPCPLPLPDLPPDLTHAVARDAARDADRVGLSLGARGLAPPLPLPAAFLLGLGAALRLLLWEQQGLDAHRQAGLPPARQALRDVFRAAAGQADPGTGTARRRGNARSGPGGVYDGRAGRTSGTGGSWAGSGRALASRPVGAAHTWPALLGNGREIPFS